MKDGKYHEDLNNSINKRTAVRRLSTSYVVKGDDFYLLKNRKGTPSIVDSQRTTREIRGVPQWTNWWPPRNHFHQS